jgi:ABC-type sugar transport system ATPase subunit
VLDCGVQLHVDRRGEGESYSPGRRVAVGIKPEDIHLGGSGAVTPAGELALTANAVVEEVFYFGSHVDVQVRLADSSWRVRAGKQFGLDVGTDVEIVVAESAVSVFPLNDS